VTIRRIQGERVLTAEAFIARGEGTTGEDSHGDLCVVSGDEVVYLTENPGMRIGASDLGVTFAICDIEVRRVG
jgi:hypothetical protein